MRAREKSRLMVDCLDGDRSYSILFMDKLGKVERDNYIKIAKELGYGPETIDKIKKAETEHEVSRILATARHEAIDKERRKHRGR